MSPAPVAIEFSSSCNPTSPGESLCAAMPEPTTIATSNAVPTASALARRARSRLSIGRSRVRRNTGAPRAVDRGEVARAEPQAQEVAFALRLGMVLVGLACVEDHGIVQELDVARLEIHLHMERGIVRDRLDQVHCGALIVGEPRYL